MKKFFYSWMEFLVAPEVYEPAEDTILLADNLDVRDGESVLELGTGCGLLAILAARAGGRVVATDINPAAIECASLNAAIHGVAEKIEFRLGNLFEPVRNERFDVIIFNPPYLPINPEERVGGMLERAWEAGIDGREVLDRFLHEAPDHLRAGGRVLFVQSSLADDKKTEKMLKLSGFDIETLRIKLSFEELCLFRCKRMASVMRV